jgi:hypothetical protein
MATHNRSFNRGSLHGIRLCPMTVRRVSRRRGECFTVAIAGGKGVSIVHVSTYTPSLNYHHHAYSSPCSLPHALSLPWPLLYLLP